MKTRQGKRQPRRSTGMNVLLMGAQTKLKKEECALGMGQCRIDMNALLVGVQTGPSKEECVEDMERRKSYAAVMDA